MVSRLKVAYLTRFPCDPDAPRGGLESVGVSLLRGLSALDDLELHVFTIDPTCAQAEVNTWRDVTIHRLPQIGRRLLTDALGAGGRQMRDHLQTLHPDVIHANDFYGLIVKKLPIPRVFTVHGFIYADTRLSGTPSAWIRSKVWWWVETSCWREQPHIISISPYVRERLAGVATGRIHDIDNPVPAVFFDIERRERPGTIFCAAHVTRLKNTLGLVEAFALLVERGVDAELRLAGVARDPQYDRRVREVIRDRRLDNRVKLLGQIDGEAIRRELASAGVFTLVSLQENAPMAVGEAMAAGVPVVASNRCGMPYMVRDGETGFLVDPVDPADIADALRRLLTDAELRARMGAQARQVARERFHVEQVARRTHDVYLRAVGDFQRRDGRVQS